MRQNWSKTGQKCVKNALKNGSWGRCSAPRRRLFRGALRSCRVAPGGGAGGDGAGRAAVGGCGLRSGSGLVGVGAFERGDQGGSNGGG
jgi:hypothetical protein